MVVEEQHPPRPAQSALLELESGLRGPATVAELALVYVGAVTAACRRDEDRGWSFHRALGTLHHLLVAAKSAKDWEQVRKIIGVIDAVTVARGAVPSAEAPWRGGRRRDDPPADA